MEERQEMKGATGQAEVGHKQSRFEAAHVELSVDTGMATGEEGVWEREDMNNPEKVALEQGWREI